MGIPAPLGVGASGLPPKGDLANAVVKGVIAAVGPTKPFAVWGPMNLVLYGSKNTTLSVTKGSLAASVASASGLAAGNAIDSVKVPRGTTVGALSSTDVTLAPPPVTLSAKGFSLSSPEITLPPGSNVASLVGAAVSVPSDAEDLVIPSGTTVVSVVQADVAPNAEGNGGIPGIVALSAAPTSVPTDPITRPLEFAVGAAAITAATGDDEDALFTGAAIGWSATVQLERSFDGGKTWIVCNIGATGQPAQWTGAGPISLTFGEPERGVLYRLNCIAFSSGPINWRISATGQASLSLSVPAAIA